MDQLTGLFVLDILVELLFKIIYRSGYKPSTSIWPTLYIIYWNNGIYSNALNNCTWMRSILSYKDPEKRPISRF